MEKPPKFIVHCSGIGQIMTNPRTKGDGSLSATCKTHLKKWLIRELTGKRVDFKSIPTDKGNAVEKDGITFASCYIVGMGLCSKNTRHFEGEYICGTPDVISNGIVWDLKSSLSAETFPLFETELPESDYEWQLQGYMSLTGKTESAIVYALMSMPEEMIEREARYKLGPYYTPDQYEAFAANYRYDDLPPSMRLRVFPVQYDADKIQQIHTRVLECRAYVETVLWPQLQLNQKLFEL